MAFVELRSVNKVYSAGQAEIAALRDVTLDVVKGEICVVVGASASGKTTLLNILGGMDAATSGSVRVDGEEISAFSPRRLTAYRRYDAGFVFQSGALMQELTALENVELAARLGRSSADSAKVLAAVGLDGREDCLPWQLSGGERQCAAVARALVKQPKLLLCDEPTAALDYATGRRVLKLMQDTCRKTSMTVFIVTHNSVLTAMADRVVTLDGGTVSSVVRNDRPTPVEDLEW
ncbi:MAG: ABC transporter ATP-binding protein [Oscillospiraceae bacterium]|nr:ABC transporter ATP-binding protein [Oscillospiraceae bacterium]